MKTGSKKTFMIIIVLLTLMNIGFVVTVISIWNKQRNITETEMRNPPRHGRFMKEEIGFNEAQMDNFKKSRKEFRETVRPIQMELRKLNHDLMTESLSDNPDTSKCNNLSMIIGQKNTEVKQAISRHMIEVSNTATPDQREKLRKFYFSMFSNGPIEERPGRQFRHRMFNN